MKVVALIPAHNESEGIERTILSIVGQTHKVEKIVVACDNCVDDTERICQKISEKYPELEHFATVENKKKKAGALNQAYKRILNEKWDVLLQVDADSILDKNLVAEALIEFNSRPKLGGICSRFRIGDYVGGNWFLYTLQYLEYSFFDSVQVEKRMKTSVLSGAASLLRREALEIFGPKVWDEDSIVEDYALTLLMKKNGWKIRVGRKMHIETDYMRSWKDLWKQRRRWVYGTAEELKKHGWQKYNREDILIQASYLFFGFFQIVFIIGLIALAIFGKIEGMHPLGIAVPIAVLMNKTYRIKYIKKKTFFNLFVTYSLIPEYLYTLFLICIPFSCYFRLLFNLQPKW